MLRTTLLLLILAFPISELVLVLRRRSRGLRARDEDRGSMRLLWAVISLSVAAGVASSTFSFGRLPMTSESSGLLALCFIVSGLVLRWTAIATLGRFFTVDVAIHGDHEVVQSGVYRWIRHPSYAGVLLVFVGMGFFFGSWLSLIVLLVPISIALWRRIEVEEAALRRAMGARYEEYAKRTKRLVPGIL